MFLRSLPCFDDAVMLEAFKIHVKLFVTQNTPCPRIIVQQCTEVPVLRKSIVMPLRQYFLTHPPIHSKRDGQRPRLALKSQISNFRCLFYRELAFLTEKSYS